jgi:hypothetical protein
VQSERKQSQKNTWNLIHVDKVQKGKTHVGC